MIAALAGKAETIAKINVMYYFTFAALAYYIHKLLPLHLHFNREAKFDMWMLHEKGSEVHESAYHGGALLIYVLIAGYRVFSVEIPGFLKKG